MSSPDDTQPSAPRTNWRHSMPTIEAYWVDKALFDLHHKPDDLARYHADREGYLAAYRLTPAMKRAIVENDVEQLYLGGVNPYLLRAHCIGMRIPEAESLAALRRAGGRANG